MYKQIDILTDVTIQQSQQNISIIESRLQPFLKFKKSNAHKHRNNNSLKKEIK